MSHLAGKGRSLFSPLPTVLRDHRRKPILATSNVRLACRRHLSVLLSPAPNSSKDENTAKGSHPRRLSSLTDNKRTYRVSWVYHGKENYRTIPPYPGADAAKAPSNVIQPTPRQNSNGDVVRPHCALSPWQNREIRTEIRSRCAFIEVIPDDELYGKEFSLRARSLFPIDQTDARWEANFRKIVNLKRHGNSEEGYEVWQNMAGSSPQAVSEWVEEFLDSHNKGRPQKSSWLTLPRDVAEYRWAVAALWLLLESPMDILDFLLVSRRNFLPPYPMMADCFIYLEMFHRAKFKAPEMKNKYVDALRTCLSPELSPCVSLKGQRGLRLYLQYSPPSDLSKIFAIMTTSKNYTSMDTLLYLADLFTENGNWEEALAVLQVVISRFFSAELLTSGAFTHRCCNLLKLDSLDRQDDGSFTFKILPKLLEMGFQPTLEIYNTVISQTTKQGDVGTALEILGLMESRGISPDRYTYSHILKGAVGLLDSEKAGLILRKIAKSQNLSQHPYMLSVMLDVMLTMPDSIRPGQLPKNIIFHAMLQVYHRAHSMEPLVDLQLVPGSHFFEAPQATQSQPSLPALGVMIMAYLQIPRDPHRVLDTFNRFKDLVARGHPIIAPLIEYDYVCNSFLMALRYYPEMIPHCLEIVDYMLNPPSNTTYKHAQPSKQTWTILLNILVSHNQIEAAEKLHQKMEERGVNNLVAWNIIIRGYSKSQLVEEAAKALKKLERQSWSPDSHTVRALGYVEDQELLRTYLDYLDSNDSKNEEKPPALKS